MLELCPNQKEKNMMQRCKRSTNRDLMSFELCKMNLASFGMKLGMKLEKREVHEN